MRAIWTWVITIINSYDGAHSVHLVTGTNEAVKKYLVQCVNEDIKMHNEWWDDLDRSFPEQDDTIIYNDPIRKELSATVDYEDYHIDYYATKIDSETKHLKES